MLQKLLVDESQKVLPLSRPVHFEHFHAKTTRSHVALSERNSGAESGRELSKGSNSASLVVCNENTFFGWGLWIFCE